MSMQRCCPPRAHEADRAGLAILFKALSDPHRLAIVAMLSAAADEICVCDFTSELPLNQPAVSHHLRILREAGLVTCERRGTWVYYRLSSGTRARIASAVSSILPEAIAA
jgi:ArsR family transcriptional regulator